MNTVDLDTVKVIRSKRKTAAIQVMAQGNVVVRVPMLMDDADIMEMVRRNADWIRRQKKRLESKRQLEEKEVIKLTDREKKMLADKAKNVFKEKVSRAAKKMQVSYGRVTIRMQKTRWGSCSYEGNLNFNCLLMLAPEEVQDYVVFHELCHRKQMNHSKEFWSEVEKVCPDYKKQKKWLKDHGDEIMRRAFQI